jgi:hypothetical protein
VKENGERADKGHPKEMSTETTLDELGMVRGKLTLGDFLALGVLLLGQFVDVADRRLDRRQLQPPLDGISATTVLLRVTTTTQPSGAA